MKNKLYPLYETNSVSNLRELMNSAAARYGESAAFAYTQKGETVTISFAQFKADVEALGAVFLSSGLRNEKIALIGENSYLWILTYFAAVNSRNVIVPIDKELPAAEAENLLIDSGCAAIVYSDSYSDIIDNLSSTALKLKYKWNMKTDLQALLNKGKQARLSGDKSLDELMIDNNAVCSIIYTSGTTGNPKGVMLSQKNLACNTVAGCRSALFTGGTMLVLPLHHTFAFTGGVLVMLHSGSTIVINQSLKYLSAELKQYSPTNILVVPLFLESFYKQIWDTAKKNNKDKLLGKLIRINAVLLKAGIDVRRKLFKTILEAFGGKLEIVVCGGAPLDAKYVDGLRCFGINVLNGYGITECSPVVAVNRNNYYRDGSVGLALSGCEIKIHGSDENGNGEILVKGESVMLGYYNNEQATAETFHDGWFKTGDIGHLDSDGFLYISGRLKNLIILSNGENIYPEELEEMILHIPLVKEAVVVLGKSSKGREPVLMTHIFPDYEYATAQNIGNIQERLESEISLLNKELPSYKHIQRVALRDNEFVKTTTKKIKRSAVN